MDEQRACRVQVLIDGREIHSFFASSVDSTQDGQRLHLVAEAWEPERLYHADNPLLATGTPIEGLLEETQCRGT